MNEQYLTMGEIEAKYPNQWVLIDKPKTTKYQEVLGGYLVMHSADRKEFIRLVFDYPEVVNCAILYTGPPVLEESELIEA
ncbi:MAG TPA: hypothetical protein VG122_03820 [Gemmata sp.]|nr:hypothetical protein [Gemmata sp.]